MTGYCGWLGDGGVAAEASGALWKAQAGGLGLAAQTPVTLCNAPDCVLLASADADSATAADGQLLVALDGDRRFTARALLDEYQATGTVDLARLRGAFSLVILDRGRRRALLAVDRMGIRPLCHAGFADGLAFGSSAAAVAAHPKIGRRLNPQAIHDFAFLHTCPAPRTIYARVAKLEAAQRLEFANGHATVGSYWTPSFTPDTRAGADALGAALRETLDGAVRRAAGDSRFGTFLSGGLDSSTVTGLAARLENMKHAYTIGFEHPDYDESHYARLAAGHFGVDLRLYFVTPQDVATSLRAITRAYDEPFGNSSAVPAYICASKAAADGVPRLLAGDGGDELFAGNERYAKQKLFSYYGMVPGWLRAGVLDPLADGPGRRATGGPLRKLYRYVDQARAGTGRRMIEVFDQRKGIAPDQLFSAEFRPLIDPARPAEDLVEFFERSPARSDLDRMLHLDWKITLADNDLRKVNRMCELAGIDVRYPMLDEEVVDLSMRVPDGLKLRGGKLRHFYKQAFGGFLPGEIINKRKHGFGLPFGEWLKTEPVLRDTTYPALESLKRRGIFDPAAIDRVVTQHREGHASYYGSMVWALLMLELWFEEHPPLL
jgi:asparagine synthase (glutamine-hydrolysing)